MIVVGCGKQKLERSAPARELYTGSLFRKARRYVEASGDRWVILSAAHGVIEPSVVIRPYEQTLPEKGEALDAWARKAAAQIEAIRAKDRVGLLLGRAVEILAGAKYADPLGYALECIEIESRQPLRGFGTGQRLCRLKRMAEEKEGLGIGDWGMGSERCSGLEP